MKKFVVGLILGAGLTFGIGAHAEVVSFVGKAIEGQFPVKVNGEVIESPGIVIDGTSYLPTRAIAELAGYDVKFDADMGVELTRKETKIPVPNVITIPSEEKESEINEQQIKDRIQYINDRLRILNLQIKMTEESKNLSEEDREALANMKSRASELEAEKAALEAQLNAQ